MLASCAVGKLVTDTTLMVKLLANALPLTDTLVVAVDPAVSGLSVKAWAPSAGL